MPECTLTYFPIAGRAEATRLAAILGGVDMEDKVVTFEEFGKLKAEGALKFGALPVLEVGGKQYGQSMAILQYVGRKGKLYPDNLEDQLAVDQILYTLESDIVSKAPQHKDEEEKKKLRREFATGKFATYLKAFDKMAGENSSGWLVGDSMTVADLAMFGIFTFLRSGSFDFVSMDDVASFKNLLKIDENIANNPKVKEYYANKKK